MPPSSRHHLSLGETIAAVAAAVLVLSTVVPWFREEAVGRFSSGLSPLVDFEPRSRMAWVTIPLLAIALVALAAVPLFSAIQRLRIGKSLRPEYLLASGALAVALVLLGASLHLGDQGEAPGPNALISASPSFGLWIALVASLAIAVGGALAMSSKRPTRDGIEPPASS